MASSALVFPEAFGPTSTVSRSSGNRVSSWALKCWRESSVSIDRVSAERQCWNLPPVSASSAGGGHPAPPPPLEGEAYGRVVLTMKRGSGANPVDSPPDPR